MLDEGELNIVDLYNKCKDFYAVKNQQKAFFRDLNYLLNMQAIQFQSSAKTKIILKVNIDWPRQITETEFFKRAMEKPKSKIFGFLSK